MKKRIFSLSMAVLMLLTVVLGLASCMGGPTNPPTTNTCTNHTDPDHDGKCNVSGCTATVKVEHVDNNHDGKCDTKTCGKTGLTVKHDDADENYICDTCDAVLEHDCVDTDSNNSCDICEADMEAGPHDCVDNEGGDGLCDICFKEVTSNKCDKHLDLNSDNICDTCGEDVDCDCVDVDGDTYCDNCSAYVAPAEVEINYPWNKTTLIVQLTENTNNQEILSVSKKYLAGDTTGDSGTTDAITDAVRNRNFNAANKTKVELDYRYYPDTKEYNWGTSIERIQETNMSGTDVPDIYTNFVYDMVGASLKGCFANLLAQNKGIRGDNYFDFLKDDYDPDRSDRGFMYEYMTSLTLAPDKKMYVLSSDYFIDMVRAFFCIPVSVKILEDSCADVVAKGESEEVVYPEGDRNEDGEFTLDDFYEMVKDGEWTYNTLAKFSEAVWKAADSNQGSCILGDKVVGFAMATGGLAASGLLYTTSVEIIHKEKNTDGTYSYDYPSNNPDFYAFCDATTKLFGESSGIVYVKESSQYTEFGDSALKAIRARFTQDSVLFGDIMLIGALEFDVYQEMKGKGGFGIVPVPLYRSGSDDEYLTQIHNIGVCGAISVVTQKFTECTAFLNYQSTHSEEILNNYYEFKLQYDLSNGSTGTIEMLQYIRSHVRSSFDKAMEDALEVFANDDGGSDGDNRWHSILQKYKFQIDIRAEYMERYNAKESNLDDLAKAFLTYPD